MPTLDKKVTAEDVETLFNILLKRPVNNEVWKGQTVGRQASVADLMREIRRSPELQALIIKESRASKDRIDDYRFRLPEHLAVGKHVVEPFLLIGSCLMNEWSGVLQASQPDVKINRILFNNASTLPPLSPDEAMRYGFQVLQIPLRSVLKEAAFYSLKHDDNDGYEKLFAQCCTFLQKNLQAIMRYNVENGIPAYLLNFYIPIQNPLGRAQSRYSLSNMVYFVEELNRRLYAMVSEFKNAWIVDLEQIVNTYGKKYFQDDYLTQLNHASVVGDITRQADRVRLEPTGKVDVLYSPDTARYITAIFHEIVELRKSEMQVDAIKLVIFDLDDTLWRGVAAEIDDPGPELAEGWPLGILEAATYLWRRGVLIAIVSKNDDQVARHIWDQVYGKKFELDKFASIKINWHPKAENVDSILRELNLLPDSTLLVDDNPVERAAVKARFPQIRVLSAPLMEWRRILLWSSQLQRSIISREAGSRTEMIQAQIRRETARTEMSHDEFLVSLGIQIDPHVIDGDDDPRFARCFELLNKTNQFNTTGKRWTVQEMRLLLAEGGSLIALDVSDRFTKYGITGLCVVRNITIEQFVLSCRVFGMGIEHAAIAIAQAKIGNQVRAFLKPTEKNGLSRDLYPSLGFDSESEHDWVLRDRRLPIPAHIRLCC